MSATRKFMIGLALMLLAIIISACGPSPEEQAATSAAETAAAATDTPTRSPSSTPTPTYTPTPTPTSTPPPTPFPPFRDDFTEVLEEGWVWLQEVENGWNLHERKGFLRLEVHIDAEQVLVRKAPEGNFDITTRVLFQPYQNFQQAGLIIYQDDEHFLKFIRAMAWFPKTEDLPDVFAANALYFDYIDYDIGDPVWHDVDPNFHTRTDELDEAFLRLTRQQGTYTAYYSSDGEEWTMIGSHESDIVPIYVGITTCCATQYLADADFDYFTLEMLP